MPASPAMPAGSTASVEPGTPSTLNPQPSMTVNLNSVRNFDNMFNKFGKQYLYGKGSPDNGYLDNLDNGSSNKYEKKNLNVFLLID
jgi:hypothetical protein